MNKKNNHAANDTIVSLDNSITKDNYDYKLTKKYYSKPVLRSKEIFEHGPDKTIPFNLVRSKRRKTSELIIENEKEITLRVPYDKPIEEIKEIIQRKIQWIFKKQEEYKRTKPEIKEYSYLPDSTLPYLGNNYKIEIRNIDSSINDIEKVNIENNKLVFYLKGISAVNNQSQSNIYQITDRDILKNRIKSLYETWLYRYAQQIFAKKINQFSKIIKVTPKELQIKRLKNRWGSITKNKKIVLNVNLVKTPQNIVDYVIKHELCHFKIEGHSYQFWRFLKDFEPDYSTKIKWLAINGKNILES